MAAAKGNQYAAKDKLMRNAALNLLDNHSLGRMAGAMAVMLALYQKACEGDVSAIKEWNDRIDGKSVQSVEGDLTVRGSLFDVLSGIGRKDNPPVA
jgi:hypothetical protein